MVSNDGLLLTSSESEIEMHDLALPLPFTTPEVLAPILVLELENMSEGCLSQTKTRIQRFAATSKGQRTVIALVLKEDVDDQASLDGTQGFMALQALCVLFYTCHPSPLLTIFLKSPRERHIMSCSPCPGSFFPPEDIVQIPSGSTAAHKASSKPARDNRAYRPNNHHRSGQTSL